MPPMISSGGTHTGTLDPNSPRSTAPVLEFICLFTHDLRRKQKRWQDGRIKYHTFNKRVMVYDERGNSIGDMHWQRDWDFDEGEEVQLDRGGVIVQVQECVGRQNQDLTELLDKRVREKEQRQARVAVRPPISVPPPQTSSSNHFQTRHRPLNQLLGTPTGHHGRAVVPTESPFELRQRANEMSAERTDSRSSKRRRLDDTPPSKMGYAQSLFGAPLTLSAVPLSSAPPRRPMSQAYRSESRASSPEEQAPSSAEPENQGSHDHAGSDPRSSTANLRAPPPRVPQEPARDAPHARNSAESTTEAPGRSYGRRMPSLLKSVTSNAPLAAKNLAIPLRSEQALAGPRPRVSPRYFDGASSMRNPDVVAKPMQTGSHGAPRSANQSESGLSCSNAIILDDDGGPEPDAAQRARPNGKANDRMRPGERIGISTERQKPAKQRNPPLPAQPPRARSNNTDATAAPVVAMPEEERTELRLKPRQKRGLLMLSEKRTKTKRVKQQSAVVNDAPTRPHPTSPSTLATSESSRGLDARIPGSPPSLHLDCPVSPPHSLGNRPSESPEVVLDAKNTRSWSSDEPDIQDGHDIVAVDFPKPSEPPCGVADNFDDEALESSPPPQRKRARAGRRAKSSTPPEEPSRVTSPSPEASPTHAASETSGSDSPRPAMKVRKAGDETSKRPRKRVQVAEKSDSGEELPEPPVRPRRAKRRVAEESESDVEETPQPPIRQRRERRRVQAAEKSDSDQEALPKAPVRPHMARLKKSIKSREIFGYVTPSQRLANLANKPAFKTVCDIDNILETDDPATDAGASATGPDQVNEALLSSEGPEPPREKSSPSLPLSRISAPDLQRQDSRSDGKTSREEIISETREDTPSTRQPDDPSSSGSAASPEGTSKNETSRLPSVDSPRNINTSSNTELVPGSTTRPSAADQKQLRTTEATALPSQLHKSRSPPDPTQQRHPITDQPDIASAVVGSRLTERPSSSSNGPSPVPPPPPPPAPPAPLSAGACTTTTAAAITTTTTTTTAPTTTATATVTATTTTTTTTRPRIPNPATRGRKAALRSDAAGQVPQSVLPSEPQQPLRPAGPTAAAARTSAAGAGGAAGAGAANERPKRGMRFPGFVSAASAKGGGPWSREAFDLLEGGRPGGE